jgi:hypothetical protein
MQHHFSMLGLHKNDVAPALALVLTLKKFKMSIEYRQS